MPKSAQHDPGIASADDEAPEEEDEDEQQDEYQEYEDEQEEQEDEDEHDEEALPVEEPQHGTVPLDAYEPQPVQVMPYAEWPLVDEPQYEQPPPPDGNLQAEEQLPQEVAEELPDDTPQLDAAPLDAYEPRRIEVTPYAESPLVDEPQHEQASPPDGNLQVEEQLPQDVAEELPDERRNSTLRRWTRTNRGESR
jgi:hypothetical protein